MLLDVLVLLTLYRFENDNNSSCRLGRRKSHRMSLRLCQIVLFLLSCRLVQSAAIPEDSKSGSGSGLSLSPNAKKAGAESSGLTSTPQGEAARSRSLLRRIGCAFGNCRSARKPRNVQFTAMVDPSNDEVTVINNTEKTEALIENPQTFKQWRTLYPDRHRRMASVHALSASHNFYWTVWKRNDTFMFGLRKNGSDRYYFLMALAKRIGLFLSRPKLEQGIDESSPDNRYFRLESHKAAGKGLFRHIASGKYLGISHQSAGEKLVLTTKTKAFDWEVKYRVHPTASQSQ